MRQILARFFISILFVMALSAATASTYVMMPDEALFDGADIVAYGRIEESLPAAGDQARHVDYRFRIDELVKGFVNWPEQTVRVLGGGQPGDTGLWISDAPRFASGDHTLLFLSRGRDGILRPFQYGLGVFHVTDSDEGLLAVRDLDPRGLIGTSAAKATSGMKARSLEPFLQWLRFRAVGIERVADYLTNATPNARPGTRFTLFENNSVNLRWFDFDTGNTVTWTAVEGGQTGTTFDEFQAFQDALQAWTDAPGATIALGYGGTVATSEGFINFDGVNAIKWNDPDDEIGGSYDCNSGGVLAFGGPWFLTDPDDEQQFSGRTYRPIAGGDIITQDNTACFFNGNGGADGAEVFAHELGHVLGFGHSCGDEGSGPCDGSPPGDSEALMTAFASGGGRGATLGEDDREATLFVYPASTETLSVTVDGNGSVITDPVGISCAGNSTVCEALFGTGLTVRLTAAPASDSQFEGWAGNCSGTNATISVEMSDSRACTAMFSLSDQIFESSFEADEVSLP